jgi:SAM-dependent methyltransferase
MRNHAPAGRAIAGAFVLISTALLMAAAARQQPDRAPGTHQDETEGREWIRRLERPDRLPGLKIDQVIARLGLRPGNVIADIGSGTGAFTVPFAEAVAPTGSAFAVDIWRELLDYVQAKADRRGITTLKTVLARRDDPALPERSLDIAFFHDVFHNVNDRPGYLKRLAPALKPGGRIAIIEQEFDDPIAKKWDPPEHRITREQVREWMASAGFVLVHEFDIFQGHNNPEGTAMPERWFVVYQRAGDPPLQH